MRLREIPKILRTVRYLKPAQVWSRLEYRTKLPWYKTGIYAAMLEVEKEQLPEKFLVEAPHLWKGDKGVGEAICENRFRFVGREVNMGKSVRWRPHEVSALWLYHLHYFEWLADLRAMGNAGLHNARRLIEDWIDECGHDVDEQLWHPYPLSLRIISWITHGQWFLKEISENERELFFASLMMQVRHLQNVLEWDVGGNHLIKNLKALIYAGLTIPEMNHLYLEAMPLFLKQLKVQILPDGAHYERSPHYHVDVLRDLLDIHALVLKTGHPSPPQLDDAIDRMVTALNFYRHGDGLLALFNDGEVGDLKVLAAIEKRCGRTGVIPKELPDAGYVRLSGGKSLLLMDVGKCCPDELPAHGHAGTLGFEMSVGKERVFVNSGTFAYQHGERNKYRGTAAHNTVCINRLDSAEVWAAFRLGRRPRKVEHSLKAQRGVGVGVEASHDGYRHVGMAHTRRIFMSDDGGDVRAEDHVLAKKRKHKKRQYARAHFHLAPEVKCHMKSHTEAEIVTPKGVKITLKVAGGRLHEAEYSYSEYFGERQAARELVLTGDWKDGQALMKWALKVVA